MVNVHNVNITIITNDMLMLVDADNNAFEKFQKLQIGDVIQAVRTISSRIYIKNNILSLPHLGFFSVNTGLVLGFWVPWTTDAIAEGYVKVLYKSKAR